MNLFVSVGTRPNQFDRLVKAADELAADKTIKVFIQAGESTFVPKNAKAVKFLSHEETKRKMEWCDAAIIHAGAGTLIELLALGKPVVLFPRLAKFGEHTNDHQIDLCKAVKEKYGIPFTLDEKELPALIKKAKSTKAQTRKSGLVAEVKRLIEA